jgi:hypothetical protein
MRAHIEDDAAGGWQESPCHPNLVGERGWLVALALDALDDSLKAAQTALREARRKKRHRPTISGGPAANN